VSAVSDPETLASYVQSCMKAVGIDSIRGLASRAGIAPETARSIFMGRFPNERTLQKIADALPASLQRMRELTARPPGEREPFVLPPEADQLNERQRSVVLAVVHALLDASTAGLQPGHTTETDHAPNPPVRLVGRQRDTNGPDV
jgi:hypothetical protein